VALHDKDSIDEGYPAAAVRLPVRLDELARRIFDLLAATMCLMLFAPILLLTSIAIKLDSRGPILIRETRYGYKNRAIDISKFRVAMVCSEGEQINQRPTRVGQLLRQTGIDELPQLFNVLRGDMSFGDLIRAIGRDGVFLP
jgi:lipopolysaccharide/colanic/teichoic acid biosynthesis glycosyltransferase